MIKINCRSIFELIASLAFVAHSSAHQMYIHFDNEESIYTNPVVYLTGIHGQIPKVAIKEGVPTTGGVYEQENNLSQFSSIAFNMTPEMDSTELNIIPFSNEEPKFCKDLKFSFEKNKILLPSTFPKLKTSTSCNYKIVPLDKNKNIISENKITFIFNYTLKGWLGNIGNGTEAKNTAKILIETDPNAKHINLNNQKIFDISPLSGFIHAQILNLDGNQIEIIPDALGNLKNLTELYISDNKINEIPEAIGNLSQLKIFLAPNNRIKLISDAIGNLTNLELLSFNNNSISVIPETIGNLTNLESLDFAYNQIKVIPYSIENLTNLKLLSLKYNSIVEIPYVIKNLVNLKYLDIYYNLIEEIPDALGELKNLNYLDLSDNQIKIVPVSLSNLTNLQELYLSINKIEEIPEELKNLKNLQFLNLCSNKLKVVPAVISKLTNLQQLDFSYNYIKEIPETLRNLANLQELSFHDNEIRLINKSLYEWLVEKNSKLTSNLGFSNNFGN